MQTPEHLCDGEDNLENNLQLTHSSRGKIAPISQMTFSNGFSWMKTYENRLRILGDFSQGSD